MSEESKKIEKSEKSEQEVAEVKTTELLEQDLDQVSGGKNYFESRSNTAKF